MNNNLNVQNVRVGRKILLFLVIPFWFSHTASALEYNLAAGYRLEHSDNARRTATNEEDETTNIATAGFFLSENNSRLETRLATTAEYRDYRNDLFEDETIYSVNGYALWKIIPDQFTWTIEDYFTQTVIDSFAVDTPDNTQDTNVFTTGPDVYLDINPVNTLQFGARYTKNTYEVSDLDDERNMFLAKWLYDVSLRRNITLNYVIESVDYENEIQNSNFDRTDVFLGFENRIARNVVRVHLGASSIERDREDDVDGELGLFSWKREIATGSNFTFTLGTNLSDEGRIALISGQDQSRADIRNDTVTGDIFREKTANFSFTQNQPFGSNNIHFHRTERTFEVSTVDNLTSNGVDFDVGYNFTATTAGILSTSYLKTEYDEIFREDEDQDIGIMFQYHPTPSLILALETKRIKRDSTDLTLNYVERLIIFTLAYNRQSISRR